MGNGLNKFETLMNNISEKGSRSQDIVSIIRNIDKTINTSNIILSCWDLDGNIEFANEFFFEFFGIEENLSLEKFSAHLSEIALSETNLNFNQAIENLRNDISNIQSEQFDLKLKINNKKRWANVIIVPVNDNDNKYYYLLGWDITENKDLIQKIVKKEQLLKEQNAKLNDAIYISESNRDSITMNYELIEKCLKLSEVFPIEWNLNDGSVKFNVLTDDIFSWNINSLTIDKFLENIHPNDINKIQFDKLYSLSLPEDNFTIDLRLKRDFNAYSWYEFRLFIVNRDASGKPMLLRGVAINIDSRKAKELALENQTKQSGAGNFNQEIYSNFIPDLRTHLHSIVGFSEIIAMEDDNIKRLKYFENIKHNNEKLLKNIDDLVEINEEVNNIKLNETSINLWEYFVEIQQIYSLKNPDINKIKIGFISPYDSNTYLLDKERLSAIIDSMIISSINNTTSGYIHFGYNVENDILKLYVNDTSNNISSEDVEIFNNASEYSDIDDTPFKIELFNSKTIAQVMDGNISISIRPEGGVTYLLELNIKKSGSNSESLHKAPENKIVKPTILIAEDVIYSFQMLKVILEDRFNVIHAENGEEAVELFEKEKPAFIFMDVKMPVLDGIEATKRIRKISPDIPIVILTAYAVRSLKKQAADAGCTELLTKPCTSKQINACIKKHIHFRSK